MTNLITLEFDLLEDLLSFKAYTKLQVYTIDKFKKLSITCRLNNRDLAKAMSLGAIPHFEMEDDLGLILSDFLNKSVFKNWYLWSNQLRYDKIVRTA